LVLLILGGVWAVILGAPLVRRRMEGTPIDSVVSFRRQLSVLERTGPTAIAPVNTLRSNRVSGPVLGPVVITRAASPIGARRMAQKRRRDVLYSLLALMFLTLTLSLVLGMRTLLYVHVLLDLLFAGYVALLIRMRNVAAEKEMKLRFLPTVQGEPALALRRSAN
jgi:hypothetical protein